MMVSIGPGDGRTPRPPLAVAAHDVATSGSRVRFNEIGSSRWGWKLPAVTVDGLAAEGVEVSAATVQRWPCTLGVTPARDLNVIGTATGRSAESVPDVKSAGPPGRGGGRGDLHPRRLAVHGRGAPRRICPTRRVGRQYQHSAIDVHQAGVHSAVLAMRGPTGPAPVRPPLTPAHPRQPAPGHIGNQPPAIVTATIVTRVKMQNS